MGEITELVLHAFAIGIGATIVMDLWAVILKHVFNIPSLNWGMVGRWLGHIPKGRFVHENIAQSAQVTAERLIGWLAHYLIGIVFGIVFIIIIGKPWFLEPSLLPALLFGVVTVIFPFFIMQPGMGAGIAASKTPNPNQARLRSVITHSVFGLGLYVSALLLSMLLS